jgi:hypothetical protein
MTHALKRLASLSAAVFVLSICASVPAAFAASSSQEGYSRPGGTSQVAISTPENTTKTQSGSFLPFTGLDIGFLVMVGGGLLGLGYGLRRLTRPERQTS